jgi:DNA processing protein
MVEWRVTAGDDGYPTRLRALARPPGLDGVGVLDDAPAVAIVGSRAARADAMALAEAVARRAVSRGRVVVSGGALGVDTAAHRGALAAGGRTVIVLGTGVDVLYPARNVGLFAAAVAAGGARISPFPRGALPVPWHFVARNTVIAALADVVVVAAAERNSGSLSTARAARRLGRPVIAAPGTPGADALLATGAAGVLATLDDLDRALAGELRPPPPPPLDDDEAAALEALDAGATDATAVAAALGWRVAAALAILDALVETGWLQLGADDRYARR